VVAIGEAREYHMKALMMVANVICLMLSAAMPALSILVLFNVKSTLSRLVAVVLLSLTFSIIMTVVAQRKADIFMATTAFAAVLVVFVGSNDGM
jgi:Na+-translocating ferredoxin:NAD+ oxidoreductase RnfD subunit